MVLVTRPDPDGRTRDLIEARGFRAVCAPLFTVRPVPLATPGFVQAVLVTSSNALSALAPSATPLLAVGDATAARARARGFSGVHSASGDAVALADLAGRLADPATGPLLLASGAGQGQALAADLRARGFRVLRRVCYVTRPARRLPDVAEAALRAGELHAAVFLSAETAATFVHLLPPVLHASLAEVAALAIGPAAARVLEKLPWHHVCAARTPTLDDVLALL